LFLLQDVFENKSHGNLLLLVVIWLLLVIIWSLLVIIWSLLVIIWLLLVTDSVIIVCNVGLRTSSYFRDINEIYI
jgi:hypothetical protein